MESKQTVAKDRHLEKLARRAKIIADVPVKDALKFYDARQLGDPILGETASRTEAPTFGSSGEQGTL